MNTTLHTLLPLIASANEGDWIELGDHRVRIIVSSQQTGGAFLLGELQLDFLGGVPPHIHEREEETFFILEGRLEATVGDQTFYLEVGDTTFAPRGIMHTWRCVSEGGARVLALVTPGDNFEPFARKMGEAQLVADEASFIRLCALAQEHGITMLPLG